MAIDSVWRKLWLFLKKKEYEKREDDQSEHYAAATGTKKGFIRSIGMGMR